MVFEVSGVEIAWWLPPLITFVIALVSSTGGLSGAFVLLPIQVSVLGFTTPAVTSTNHLYNVVGIPSGVYRYFKEGRLVWPLVITLSLGTLPGVALGSLFRITMMPDPVVFKLFMGFVLFLIGSRMCLQNAIYPIFIVLGLKKPEQNQGDKTPEVITTCKTLEFSWKRFRYTFANQTYSVSVPILFAISLAVGIIGGAYGVGGGAILAPFLVSYYGLPVYTIAGASLLSTFLASFFAVIFFVILAPIYGGTVPITPDWALGIMFGIGGLCGTYLGARLQKHLPAGLIKGILGVGVTFLALRYIIGYFLS